MKIYESRSRKFKIVKRIYCDNSQEYFVYYKYKLPNLMWLFGWMKSIWESKTEESALKEIEGYLRRDNMSYNLKNYIDEEI